MQPFFQFCNVQHWHKAKKCMCTSIPNGKRNACMNNKDYKQQHYRLDTKQVLAFSVAVKRHLVHPLRSVGMSTIPAHAVFQLLAIIWNEYIPAYAIFQLLIQVHRYISQLQHLTYSCLLARIHSGRATFIPKAVLMH